MNTYGTLAILFVMTIMGLAFHEWGHLITAKHYHVKVDKFVIGFGPVIFKKKFHGTEYMIKAILAGGYCSIDSDEFNRLSLYKKIIIYIIGIINNLILAFGELFICFMLANPHKRVIDILFHTLLKFFSLINEFAFAIPKTIVELFTSLGSMNMAQSYIELGNLITQQTTIYMQIASLLVAAASLNIMIALFNLIPFPGLDGGNIAIILVTKLQELTGKKISYEKLHVINTIGFFALWLFTGYILFRI